MTSQRGITLTAPISGPLVELEKVPDPVFAQKMVGDGISIDPTSNLLVAPCAGTITQVHGSPCPLWQYWYVRFLTSLLWPH